MCPAYITDALLRKVNVDRYDDREIVQTNLIESYTKLFDFAKKHLPDKFYVEDTERKSLRNIIIREMVSNTLMHREFTSSFPAKFIIEEDKILVENANRARHSNLITPENLEPYPKNPIIASFFRTIGYADQLGSGVRKLFKYTHLYSGGNPSFAEGDIFRITVPLDEAYSYDDNAENDELPNKSQETYFVICNNTKATNAEIAILTEQSQRTVRNHIEELKKLNLIRRVGAKKNGYWQIIETENKN